MSGSVSRAADRKSTMPYVRLGKSGLKVSRIILGCMSYGTAEWQGWVLPEEEGLKHIKAAYDAGIQTFDTADVYSNGLSEVILGKAIKQFSLPREELVIMTKLFSPVARDYGNLTWFIKDLDGSGFVNQYGLCRKHIFEAVKASLERLQVDCIDVLQCHRFDPNTPIEETMQALHDVVKAGYVRYIGMSSCYAWQFSAMQNYAIVNKLTPFISMQNHYNLVYREEEREMMPTLKHYGVGCIPWSPLARGYVTRPRAAQEDQTQRANTDLAYNWYDNESNRIVRERVEEIAKKRGFTMAQVALLWMLGKDPVSAPIVGTTKVKNLEDLIAVVNEKLTEDEMKYLEEPYKPMAVFGH